MGVKYEIDHLSKFHRGLCNDYPYVVIIKLPFCVHPGPFRIITKTLKQAKLWKHRKRITKINMWPYKLYEKN